MAEDAAAAAPVASTQASGATPPMTPPQGGAASLKVSTLALSSGGGSLKGHSEGDGDASDDATPRHAPYVPSASTAEALQVLFTMLECGSERWSVEYQQEDVTDRRAKNEPGGGRGVLFIILDKDTAHSHVVWAPYSLVYTLNYQLGSKFPFEHLDDLPLYAPEPPPASDNDVYTDSPAADIAGFAELLEGDHKHIREWHHACSIPVTSLVHVRKEAKGLFSDKSLTLFATADEGAGDVRSNSSAFARVRMDSNASALSSPQAPPGRAHGPLVFKNSKGYTRFITEVRRAQEASQMRQRRFSGCALSSPRAAPQPVPGGMTTTHHNSTSTAAGSSIEGGIMNDSELSRASKLATLVGRTFGGGGSGRVSPHAGPGSPPHTPGHSGRGSHVHASPASAMLDGGAATPLRDDSPVTDLLAADTPLTAVLLFPQYSQHSDAEWQHLRGPPLTYDDWRRCFAPAAGVRTDTDATTMTPSTKPQDVWTGEHAAAVAASRTGTLTADASATWSARSGEDGGAVGGVKVLDFSEDGSRRDEDEEAPGGAFGHADLTTGECGDASGKSNDDSSRNGIGGADAQNPAGNAGGQTRPAAGGGDEVGVSDADDVKVGKPGSPEISGRVGNGGGADMTTPAVLGEREDAGAADAAPPPADGVLPPQQWEAAKARVFACGLADDVRCEFWEYLLGVYVPGSTTDERAARLAELTDEYYVYYTQWTSMTPVQTRQNAAFRDTVMRVEKDVVRTDRTVPLYSTDGGEGLRALHNILMCYTQYNADLGYCQGMSDVVASLYHIFRCEVKTFWAFTYAMEEKGLIRGFQKDQRGIAADLEFIGELLHLRDPDLVEYLTSIDALNFSFCFRWIVVHFKREFSFDDVFRLWDVLWTCPFGPNYHLLLAASAIHHSRIGSDIADERMDFDEILRIVNDMSHNIPLDFILHMTHALYYELAESMVHFGKAAPTLRELTGGNLENVMLRSPDKRPLRG